MVVEFYEYSTIVPNIDSVYENSEYISRPTLVIHVPVSERQEVCGDLFSGHLGGFFSLLLYGLLEGISFRLKFLDDLFEGGRLKAAQKRPHAVTQLLLNFL